MHFRLILQIQGFLLAILGLCLLAPIPFSLYYGESDWIYFVYSAVICGVFGGLALITRERGADIRPKEGFAVVTFGWIVLAAFSALPFWWSGAIPSYTDAFFESISGLTTTGASILTDIESMSHGMLFWRNFINWLGGMGIIVLTIAILPFLGVGGMQLFKAESPGPIADRLKPRVTETAKLLWMVYLFYTVLILILLLFGGMSFFDAICHAFSTIATAGFSPKNASIAHYQSTYIDFVLIIFMSVAAINFSLHYKLLTGDWKTFLRSRELRFFFGIIAVATLIIIGDRIYHTNDAVGDLVDTSLFQVISIISTTGLANDNFEIWPAISQKVIFLIMFIGGMAGSTGGGIKVIRIIILIKFIFSEIQKLLHPNAIVNIRIGEQIIDRSILANVAGFFVIFCVIAVLGTVFMSLQGLDAMSAFTSVITTLNNVGPGFGMIGPADNYAFISDAGKWALSFFMLIGRLEFFTVLILLSPSYWTK
jgi:trk/ktr system potassium uptake protein